MLKYLSPSAVAKTVLMKLKSVYCELTHIVLLFIGVREGILLGGGKNLP